MTKADIFDHVKSELIRSNADRRHPFRLVTMATAAPLPQARIVVKRQSMENLDAIIYTDVRSPKVEEITHQPQVSLLFYHERKKLQVRVEGVAYVITEGEVFEKHKEKVIQNPSDYITKFPPGHSSESASIQKGNDLHFCVIKVRAQKLDILQLGREHHHRVLFTKNEKGVWDGGHWLVP